MSYFLQTLRKMRKSVLVTWLFTYLIVLMIPIFANLFNSYYLKTMMKEEIENSNEMFLEAVQVNLDKVLHDIVSISNIVYLDKRLSDMYIIPYGAPSYSITASACMDLLKTLINNNGDIDIMIYLPEQNFIITPSTANTSENIYVTNESKYSDIISYEEWITTLSSYYSYNFSVRSYLSYKNFNIDSVVFARTIPSASSNDRYANIFVSIPFENFVSINQEFMPDTDMAIYTNEGDILHQSLIPFIPPNMEFDLESDERYVDYQYNRDKYVCSYLESGVVDWIYALFTPTDMFWKKFSYVNMSITFSVALALVVGIISVVMIIRKNYKSVSSVLTLISNSTPGQNEFSLIADAYKRVNQENSLIKDSISSQKSILSEMYFLSILKGLDNGFVESTLDILDLKIDGEMFGLVSIMFNNINKTFPDENADIYEYNDIVTFAVKNVFDELFSEEFTYNTVKDGKYLVFLFQLKSTDIDWEEKCSALLNQMYEFFINRLGITLVIVMTDVYESFKETTKRYLRMSDTFEYSSSIGLAGLIKADTGESDLKFADQDELFYAIEQGDLVSAEDCLDRLFEGMLELKIPFRIIQARVFNVLSVVFESFYKAVPSNHDKNAKIQNMMSRILTHANVPDLFTETRTLVKALCQIVNQQSKNELSALSVKVKEYIDKNYMNSDLNISTVTSELNLEGKNISKEFKDENAMGILDYISLVRINHAKKIMAESNMTVEEVALKVGYTNERTFRRAFAKIEGVTPGKYFKDALDD